MLLKHQPNPGVFFRLIERMACVVLGEPARIIRSRDLDRLERLAYREELRAAEERGDMAFIEREIERNQLTPEVLAKIAKFDTPVAEWPDTDPDIIADDAFAPTDDRQAISPS